MRRAFACFVMDSSCLGAQIEILSAANDAEIRTALAELRDMRIEALLFAPDPVFDMYLRPALQKLPPPYPAVPAMYWSRTIVEAGGLMSYGSNVVDMFYQVGIYVGRVLRGEKPTELPVLQPTKFDFVINLKTAKALGLTIPETLLATAEEVIQ
jgi:putative ABC transport system substrate-binding protein